jgi:diguanylate cyclase (GGDEF)-like protein/PAS domain S-box-containing protein
MHNHWKFFAMAFLLTGAVITMGYCHSVLKTGVIFTHFFYVPIILASIWWKRNGVWIAVFLAVALFLSHLIFLSDKSFLDDLVRIGFFLFISSVVAVLNEKLELSHKEIQKLFMELRQIFEAVGHGICVINNDFRIMYANKAYSEMASAEWTKVEGKHCYEVWSSTYCHTPQCPLKKALESGEGQIEYEEEIIRTDGSKLSCSLMATTLLGEDKRIVGIVKAHKDITQLKALEDELRDMSLTDELTSLYNRRGFLTLAEQQLKVADRTNESIFLSLIDLDGMKWVNDNLGHEEGDRLLIDTANILKNAFRSSDIIARIGGDEFTVLALNANAGSSDVIDSRLRSRVDEYNHRGNRSYRISMSIGTILYRPGDVCSLTDLMAQADSLMYEDKKTRKAL